MKAKAMITMLVSVAMILTAPLVAMGARPVDKGPPGGGGGPPVDNNAAGALYGDLYVIERDGNGEPVTRTVTYKDTETGGYVDVECQQPLAEDCSKLKLWGDDIDFNPEYFDACAVYSGGESPTPSELVQTVSFGRQSVSRSPASVLDHSYAEALNMIIAAYPSENNCASQAIKLDPAGRIMLCLPTEEDPDSHAWKTIDAPLENLGMYRAVMTDGCLDNVVVDEVDEEGAFKSVSYGLTSNAKGYLTDANLGHLNCKNDPLPQPEDREKADMLSAAVFLAAGADKFSPVTLDEIINVNTYLGVNTYTYVREQKVTTLTVEYFDFLDSEGRGGWFSYTRGTDACVPGTTAELLYKNNGSFSINSTLNVFGDSPPGVDLRSSGNGVAITVCREGSPLQETGENVVCDDAGTNGTPGSNPVYGSDDDDILGCGGANWFAQAAEDARKTIWYLHNWRVPEIAY